MCGKIYYLIFFAHSLSQFFVWSKMQEYLAKCLNILHVFKNSLKKSVSRGECTYLYISNSMQCSKLEKIVQWNLTHLEMDRTQMIHQNWPLNSFETINDIIKKSHIFYILGQCDIERNRWWDHFKLLTIKQFFVKRRCLMPIYWIILTILSSLWTSNLKCTLQSFGQYFFSNFGHSI